MGSYVPSYASSYNKDSEGLDDSTTDGDGLEEFSGAIILVMWSNLLLLLSKCQKPGCGAAVLSDNMKVIRNGAAVKILSTCNDGHKEEWLSSKPVKGVPLVNLLIVCYAFFSGLNWAQFKAFCDKIGLLMISTSTFYRYLTNLIYRCTYEFWLREQAQSINSLLRTGEDTGQGVRVAGDGRFDSPGWSARYCNYFIQDLASRKVVAFMVACKDQAAQ